MLAGRPPDRCQADAVHRSRDPDEQPRGQPDDDPGDPTPGCHSHVQTGHSNPDQRGWTYRPCQARDACRLPYLIGSGSPPDLAEPDTLQRHGREQEQRPHDVQEESGGVERHLDLLLSVAWFSPTLRTSRRERPRSWILVSSACSSDRSLMGPAIVVSLSPAERVSPSNQWVQRASRTPPTRITYLEVRPEGPSGSLALMRPISRVAFCAPRCAYVGYAHSGVPHPTKPTGFAGTPSRRLLGSGPPERQISRPGFRPHLWLAAVVRSRSRPYGRRPAQHITPKWKTRWNLFDGPRQGGGTVPVPVGWSDRARARATAGFAPRGRGPVRRRPGYRQAASLPEQHRAVEPAALCQLAVESKRRRIMNWTLEVVTVPVRDVERAKHFYSEQVGFVVDHDTRFSEEVHFVQLTPPG